MSQESNELPSEDGLVNDRVQELTWAMVDDQITADEARLLESLLLSDDHAARKYVECVQLHSDLLQHFATTEKSPTRGEKSPILGFLGVDPPPFGSQPPASKDSRS
jgi:hypothetical protein